MIETRQAIIGDKDFLWKLKVAAMKRVLCLLSMLLVLSGCVISKPTVSKSDTKNLELAFKGMELNSWRSPDGEWCFSILKGTNREKIIAEITDSKTRISGLDNLKIELAKLPKGERVFWVNYAKEPVPKNIIDALMEYSKEIEIKLIKP
ncbi:MAG: hypothetical protein WCS96_09400 [Victivallales bacterium]